MSFIDMYYLEKKRPSASPFYNTVNLRVDITIFLTELTAPFQITEGAFRKMTKFSREVHCRESKRTTGSLACPLSN